MKKLFSVSAVAVGCMLLLTQCTKDDMSKTFHAHFYTTKETGKMFLFIDGVSKGELAPFSDMSACGDVANDAANVPITLEMKSGTYQVVGKDAQGNVLSRSTMTISKTHMGVCGGIGGGKMVSNEDCLSYGLIE